MVSPSDSYSLFPHHPSQLNSRRQYTNTHIKKRNVAVKLGESQQQSQRRLHAAEDEKMAFLRAFFLKRRTQLLLALFCSHLCLATKTTSYPFFCGSDAPKFNALKSTANLFHSKFVDGASLEGLAVRERVQVGPFYGNVSFGLVDATEGAWLHGGILGLVLPAAG